MGRATSSLGSLTWTKVLGPDLAGTAIHRFNRVTANAAGDGYVAVGSRTFDSNDNYEDVWIAQIDTLGSIVDEVTLGSGAVEYTSNAVFLDSGIAIAAMKLDAAWEGYAAWLIRTDATGQSCSEP